MLCALSVYGGRIQPRGHAHVLNVPDTGAVIIAIGVPVDTTIEQTYVINTSGRTDIVSIVVIESYGQDDECAYRITSDDYRGRCHHV